ncbi:MAG TPA: hypothetical protein VHB98_23645 [Chloroflexota bacterium]|nr:hypothetical protein [Chloroflexota bacterium]
MAFRVLLDVPLAALTAIQFLRQQERMMELLGSAEDEQGEVEEQAIEDQS